MGRLCPICFTRFVDYETGDDLEIHIMKDHSHEQIAKAYHEIRYYQGFLEMIARDHNVSLWKHFTK